MDSGTNVLQVKNVLNRKFEDILSPPHNSLFLHYFNGLSVME